MQVGVVHLLRFSCADQMALVKIDDHAGCCSTDVQSLSHICEHASEHLDDWKRHVMAMRFNADTI